SVYNDYRTHRFSSAATVSQLSSVSSLSSAPPPPRSTRFPYTTLFRSRVDIGRIDRRCSALRGVAALDVWKAVIRHLRPPNRSFEIGRAHVLTPVTSGARMPSSA